MKYILLLLLILLNPPLLAGNEIHLNLPDFSNQISHLNMTFRVSVPSGQKITKGPDSHIEFERHISGKWEKVGKVSLNESLDLFGLSRPVKFSTPINQRVSKLRLKGTLYHCPRPDTAPSSKSYCVIQNVKGLTHSSTTGKEELYAHIKGTMINPNTSD
jgi:hypothetical protein